MMKLTVVLSLLALVRTPLLSQAATANGTPAAPSAERPGRDPRQPIDEEYTKKILEYTT